MYWRTHKIWYGDSQAQVSICQTRYTRNVYVGQWFTVQFRRVPRVQPSVELQAQHKFPEISSEQWESGGSGEVSENYFEEVTKGKNRPLSRAP